VTILTLVRHGETDWNREGRIQGSTDIPLNDEGRAQARAAAELLASETAGDVRVVVSSDQVRAAETADIIAAALGVEVLGRYPGLRERGYGEAEGLDTAAFRSRFAGGQDVPGAEPWPDVRARALAAITAAVDDARGASGVEHPQVIAVSHGALIRQIIRVATDEQLPRDGERLPNASLHRFAVEPEGLRLLSYVGASV